MQTVQLKCGDSLNLPGMEGTSVRIVAGAVWVTQLQDAWDHVLGAGGEARIQSKGTTLIYALEESTVSFAP
jgi:hypothetical protein